MANDTYYPQRRKSKNNPEKQRAYRLEHKERLDYCRRELAKRNRVEDRCKKREYYARTRDARRAYSLQYRKDHPESSRAAIRKFSQTEKFKKWRKQWLKKPIVRAKIRADQQRRLRTNINARLANNLRNRLVAALRGIRKSESALKLLGCSLDDFRIYMESKFEPGMTWANYGNVWEIDHIMPCAIFDLTKPGHQKRCCHFSNLQPLWVTENRIKHAKVLSDQLSLL